MPIYEERSRIYRDLRRALCRSTEISEEPPEVYADPRRNFADLPRSTKNLRKISGKDNAPVRAGGRGHGQSSRRGAHEVEELVVLRVADHRLKPAKRKKEKTIKAKGKTKKKITFERSLSSLFFWGLDRKKTKKQYKPFHIFNRRIIVISGDLVLAPGY